MSAMFRRTLTADEVPAAQAKARRDYEQLHMGKLGRPPSAEDCDRWWPAATVSDTENVAC